MEQNGNEVETEDLLVGGFVAWKGRQWAVTDVGLECLDGGYVLEKDCLLAEMPEWSPIRQLARKAWVDLEELEVAWLIAIALHTHPRHDQIHEQINLAHCDRLNLKGLVPA